MVSTPRKRGGGNQGTVANGPSGSDRPNSARSANSREWVDFGSRRRSQASALCGRSGSGGAFEVGPSGVLIPAAGAFGGLERGFGPDGRWSSDVVRALQSGSLGGLTSGDFAGSRALWIRPDLPGKERVTEPYREVWVIRAALRAFAGPFSRLPIQVWSGPPSEQGSTVVPSHPLVRLLDSPNNLQTRSEFWEAAAIAYKLDGECFFFLADAQGKPVADRGTAVDPLPTMPAQVIAVRGSWVQHALDKKTGIPVAYRYQTSGDTPGGNARGAEPWSAEFPASSVVVLRAHDPDYLVRGLGDVTSLVNEIDLFHQARRSINGTVSSGGDPGAWITYDAKLSVDERQRREAVLNDELNRPDAPRYKVLMSGAKVTPNPVKPKDMEYPVLLDWSLHAMLAVVGTPPPCIGILDEAHYNNAETAERLLWKGPNGILSFVRVLEELFTTRLLRRLPRTGGSAASGGAAFVAFDTSGVEALQDTPDVSTRAQVAAEIRAICLEVSAGRMPHESAIELIVETLPVIDRDAARKIIEPIELSVSAAGAEESSQRQQGNVASDDGDSIGSPRRAASLLLNPPARGVLRSWDPTSPIEPDERISGAVERWFRAYGEALGNLWTDVASSSSRRAGRARETRQLSQADIALLLLNEWEWEERLHRLTDGPVRGVYLESLEGARIEWGGGVIEATDPRVLAALSRQRIVLTSVPVTVEREVRSLLLRFFADADEAPVQELIAEALPELTEELRRTFGNKRRRADAIARTETGHAQNSAAYLQLGEAGAATVRWAPPPDGPGRRERHQDLRGVEVPYGTPFPNGLLHPHAPGAPASEVVNCACRVVVGRFEGDE